jgi:predicted secreted protein
MKLKALAAAAGLGFGLAAAGCNPTTAEDKPVADQPADPAAPDQFADALNFECEGAGKLDVILQDGTPPTALVRLAGGAAMTLPLDTTAPSGMVYKDATTTINLEGGDLQLTTGGATKPCRFVSRELPAPKVGGVVRDLTSADAGASVEMKVGEKMSVSLVGVPTAGYVWGAASPPAFVKITDGPGGSTTSAQRLPGFAGGNHWEVLVIEAVSPGEGEITLVQKRPWEDKPDPADQTFKFKLKVQ